MGRRLGSPHAQDRGRPGGQPSPPSGSPGSLPLPQRLRRLGWCLLASLFSPWVFSVFSNSIRHWGGGSHSRSWWPEQGAPRAVGDGGIHSTGATRVRPAASPGWGMPDSILPCSVEVVGSPTNSQPLNPQAEGHGQRRRKHPAWASGSLRPRPAPPHSGCVTLGKPPALSGPGCKLTRRAWTQCCPKGSAAWASPFLAPGPQFLHLEMEGLAEVQGQKTPP